MEKINTSVGLDVHKKSTQVALLKESGELEEWRECNDGKEAARLARKIKKLGEGKVVVCYEAGPCGYQLQRELEKRGLECQVVAPSLIPVKPGEKVKTDRRDALKLARYLRMGLLQEVAAPSLEEEALRELTRCRKAIKEDVLRARHRVSKFLLRHGQVYGQGQAWTKRYWGWLKGIQLGHGRLQEVFENYLLDLERREEELKRVEEQIRRAAEEEWIGEQVGWLRCFRGIDTLTAVTVISEVYAFGRFRSPRGLMNYLGMFPGERSSGERRTLRGISKAGNKRMRRILVEAAWHYRHRPLISRELKGRRKGQPAWVVACADRAMSRLNRRYHYLAFKGKSPQKVVVALARELVGFIWAVLMRPHQVSAAAAA